MDYNNLKELLKPLAKSTKENNILLEIESFYKAGLKIAKEYFNVSKETKPKL